MGYFPFFVDLSDQRGLLVGGGPVALRKARHLLDFGAALTVVAPVFCEEFSTLAGVTLCPRPFEAADLTDMAFAVAATDDPACNHAVALLCRERGIPVNSVTGREESTFLFPALLRRGCLTVGLSTGGASPAAAACLRAELDRVLPEHLEEILTYLEEKRLPLRSAFADQKDRAAVYAALYQACAAAGRALEPDEEAALLRTLTQERGERP